MLRLNVSEAATLRMAVSAASHFQKALRDLHFRVMRDDRGADGGDDEIGHRPNAGPTGRRQDDDRDPSGGQILLIAQVEVGRDEHLERRVVGRREQVPVPQLRAAALVAASTTCPTRTRRSGAGVPWSNRTRTQAAVKALRAACSSTARTCWRVTPGNHSTNSCVAASSSRFSNNAATGTRVPRNSHAPLYRSESRSTAGHEDQSIIGAS